MIRRFAPLAAVASIALLAGCAGRTPPVEVSRFHLGQPVERGTVAVEPVAGTNVSADSLEFRTYAGAVQRQLSGLGYVQGQPATSLYVARINVRNGTREAIAQGSPVSIGIGGGTGGFRGGGVGLGASFGLGGNRSRDVLMTELSVQMRRRSDGSVAWEGRATGEARQGTPEASPEAVAERLAAALFQEFPGESGRTVEVR